MGKMLTVAHAAQEIGVSADTLRRWGKKGLIKASRSGNNYRLFDMDEVRRAHRKFNGDDKTNKYKILKSKKRSRYTCIDLFAGAGGTALGLHNAGINHVLLNEFDKDAVETLRTNRPNWSVSSDDIHQVTFKKYLGSVDIVEGGFPCQAFSYAGKKLGFGDTRGTLFHEFVRCVNEVRPKIAVGENVRGLLRHDGGKTLKTMAKALEDIGYRVSYKVLRSQYLDVPQKRERLIIVGLRSDIDAPFVFPKERDYTISMKEAIGDKPKAPGQAYTEKKREVMEYVPPGGYWRDLPIEVQKKYMGKSFYQGGGKTGMARRLAWEEPSLTLTCNPAQKQTERCHPEETRPLNVREYARIQTFPDDWKFASSTNSQYKQIGNAVPVNLGYHIGQSLKAMLDGNVDQNTMILEEISSREPTSDQLQLLPI